MQKSDRPSPITTCGVNNDHCACAHLQLALPTRQSLWACGNASRQRSPPCHSSLLAKKGTDSPALRRTALTTRSKPSETIFTSAPRRRQNSRKAGKPGSIRTERICSSSASGVARSRATWRVMHSREEICPPCQAASISRHAGSAKCSSRRSVGSSGATVPSKSTRIRQFGVRLALHALKAQTDAGSARLIVERLGSREKPGVAIGRNPVAGAKRAPEPNAATVGTVNR